MSILLNYPFQHFFSTVFIEIDIDIGHRYPVRVKKPLKKEVVEQWVHIRNPDAVGHYRPGSRSTSGTH